MSERLIESTVESAALAWLESAGWRTAHGPDIAPDLPAAECADCGKLRVKQVEQFLKERGL